MKEQQSNYPSPPTINLSFSEVLQKECEIFSFHWHHSDTLQVSLDSDHPRLSHVLHTGNSPFELIGFHLFTPAESGTLFIQF